MLGRLIKLYVIVLILKNYFESSKVSTKTIKVYYKTFWEYSSWLWLFAYCENFNFRVIPSFRKKRSHLCLPNRFTRENWGTRENFGLDTTLWENKVRMHETFEWYDIPTPYTTFVERKSDKLKVNGTKIIKGNLSSGSREVIKVDSSIIDMSKLKWVSDILLVQDYIPFQCDYRVIVTPKGLHSILQRCNVGSEWMPTSNNGKCEFHWYKDTTKFGVLIDMTRKLDLKVAAWDVCFSTDKELMVLEVSPLFMPRPSSKNPNQKNGFCNRVKYELARYIELRQILNYD